MSVAPAPDPIYERATAEGRRRLSLSTLEEVSAGCIAVVTIDFGIVGRGPVADGYVDLDAIAADSVQQ